MWKDSRTDGAGPHAQGGGDVGRLRMSGQMFAQAALVDVVFAAHWTGVRRCSALDGAGRRSRNGPSATYASRQTAQAVDHVRRDAQAAQRRRQAAATANLLLLMRVRLLLMLLRRQQRRHRRRLLLLVDVMGQRRKQTVLMGHQHRRAGRTFASRRRSFAGHGGRAGRSGGHNVFVNVFHVFHEGLVAEEELVAQRTAGRVGSANQGRVLGRVGAQRGLGGEAFAAYGALKRPVLGPLQLGIVIAKVLLQIRQLDEGSSAFRHVATVRSFTCMKASVLLDVTELLETAIAIRATIRFFARVDADVLHQLVVGRKRLETLLALVRLRFAPVGVPGVHLHRRLGHENFWTLCSDRPRLQRGWHMLGKFSSKRRIQREMDLLS